MKRILYEELEMDYNDNGTIFYLVDGQLFSGIAYEIYPNGKLKSESEYQDGLEKPYLKEWYSNGKLKYEQIEEEGVVIKNKEWFESGTLKKEMVHTLGFCIFLKEWNASGHLIEEFEMTVNHPSFLSLQEAKAKFDNR